MQIKCYEKYALDYLYDCMLQILHSNASFETLSKIYNDFHFKNVPMDMMPKWLETLGLYQWTHPTPSY